MTARSLQTSLVGRRFGRFGGGLAVAGAACLAFVSGGRAHTPTDATCGPPPSVHYCIEGGTTTLNLSAAWLKRVAASGARVTAIAPAVLRGRRITFPIVSTGPQAALRHSRVPADDARAGASCARGLRFGDRTVVHHRGGLALIRRSARLTLDVPVISDQSFGLRARSNKGSAALMGEVLSENDRRIRFVSNTRFAVEGLSVRFRTRPSPLADLVPSGDVGGLSLDLRVAPRPACAG